MVPHARASARGPKQPKRGFRPRGARVAPRGVRVAETSGSSSASPRARTSAIAAEPPLTAASAAAASGACSAISPEPQAGSESDRCRAGKPFFREGHRLAVGRARVSARGGVGDDASAPSKERERAEGAERPERRSDASLAKGDGPTRQPGRCRCATYDARPTPARLDAAPDERATVPPLPLLRVETRAHSAAAPRERPRWLSRDVTRASPAEPPMPKREIERVVAFQRTLSRRARELDCAQISLSRGRLAELLV